MRLRELAARLGCDLDGDGDVEITGVNTLDGARPGDLTFVASSRYRGALAATRATAALVPPDISSAPCAVLRCANPYLSLADAIALLAPVERPAAGVHALATVAPDATLDKSASVGPFAVVDPGARIGARTVIGPHVVIGADAQIGDDCWLHAHVSVRERCRLGDRVVLQNGVVIGGDGFGFARAADGSHRKIPQVARVFLEDDVEVGANSTIDRPAVGETRIGAGTKIDNLVQIAHGVVVGKRTLIAAQSGLAGSVVVGDDVMLGGQVGVAGHLRVGDRVKASAKTGITGSIEDDAFVSGYPADDNLAWRKSWAAIRRVPELRARVRELEERLAALESTSVPKRD